MEKSGISVGVLTSVPLIPDSELLLAEDEALRSFPCGSFTKMTNYSWKGSSVTVKELQINHTHQHTEQHGYPDLLVMELDFCCRLFHPHLLQLMAASFSDDLQQNKLVYERVHVGSLYTLLYHRQVKVPVLQLYEGLSLILQVCEALFYLHSRSLVLRTLSSHSIIIVHPGVAKVTGLSFMVPRDCNTASTPPVPVMLYNWVAPEVITRNSCTGKADLYSVCALIQELYTDSVPWGSVNPRLIKQAVDEGQALSADPAVPQPYYNLLLNGLKPRAHERTCTLQDLRNTLQSGLREWSEGEIRKEVHPHTEIRLTRGTEHPDEQQAEDQEIQDQLQELDSSISNHISSIVLNLKVSQVLLQQAESRMRGVISFPEFDELDRLPGLGERQVVMLTAVGPPSSRYTPSVEIQDAVKFCSIGEESLKNSERVVSSVPCSLQELSHNHHAERNWTCEVRAAVARVAQCFMSCAAGALVGSSDGEKQCPLIEAQGDTQPGRLFENFADVNSESEESTDFHTINDTFMLPSPVSWINGQHKSAGLHQWSLNTLKQNQHHCLYTPQGALMTDIADLSSITCLSAQLQEWTRQNGALTSPCNTRFPCNSTPHSLRTCSGRGTLCRKVCVSPLIPHLEMSPWDSSEYPSHTESYNTARLGHTDTINLSVSNILQSPAERSFFQGDSDSPGYDNPEVTTASSGEKRSQERSDTPGSASGMNEAAQALCEEKCVEVEEQKKVMKYTMRDCTWSSSEDPTDITALVPITARVADDEEEVSIEEEQEGKDLSDAEQNKESYREEILEEQETQNPDAIIKLVTVLEYDTEKDRASCDIARLLEESKRAHSTLDDVLQDLLENSEAQRTVREATTETQIFVEI